MKSRKIFLDFTSLLDITMIILFFFLINFKFSADEVKAEAAEQMEAAAALNLQLEEDRQQFEKEKEEWKSEAETELRKIREADENAADNAQALMDFQSGKILKIDLKMQNRSDWKITVFNGKSEIGEIFSENSENIGEEIILLLNDQGFRTDDVVIGIFMYDPSDIGSAWIIEDFISKIREINGIYENFYCAEVRK